MVRVKSVSEGIANRKETKMNGSMRSWLCAVCMGLAAAILNVGCEGDGGSSKSAAGTDTAGSTVREGNRTLRLPMVASSPRLKVPW